MTTDGPAPARIVAAAASVSAGIGLMALLATTGQPAEIIVQVEPTPVIVEPAERSSAPEPVRPVQEPRPEPISAAPVEAATPGPTTLPTTTAPVVTTTEGS